MRSVTAANGLGGVSRLRCARGKWPTNTASWCAKQRAKASINTEMRAKKVQNARKCVRKYFVENSCNTRGAKTLSCVKARGAKTRVGNNSPSLFEVSLG